MLMLPTALPAEVTAVSPDTAHALRVGVQRAARDPLSLTMSTWKFPGTCRTAFCLAGHIIEAFNPAFWDVAYDPVFGPKIEGERLAGLTDGQGEQLFYMHQWPQPFSQRYFDARWNGDHPGAVAALHDRVEHFIATGE